MVRTPSHGLPQSPQSPPPPPTEQGPSGMQLKKQRLMQGGLAQRSEAAGGGSESDDPNVGAEASGAGAEAGAELTQPAAVAKKWKFNGGGSAGAKGGGGAGAKGGGTAAGAAPESLMLPPKRPKLFEQTAQPQPRGGTAPAQKPTLGKQPQVKPEAKPAAKSRPVTTAAGSRPGASGSGLLAPARPDTASEDSERVREAQVKMDEAYAQKLAQEQSGAATRGRRAGGGDEDEPEGSALSDLDVTDGSGNGSDVIDDSGSGSNVTDDSDEDGDSCDSGIAREAAEAADAAREAKLKAWRFEKATAVSAFMKATEQQGQAAVLIAATPAQLPLTKLDSKVWSDSAEEEVDGGSKGGGSDGGSEGDSDDKGGGGSDNEGGGGSEGEGGGASEGEDGGGSEGEGGGGIEGGSEGVSDDSSAKRERVARQQERADAKLARQLDNFNRRPQPRPARGANEGGGGDGEKGVRGGGAAARDGAAVRGGAARGRPRRTLEPATDSLVGHVIRLNREYAVSGMHVPFRHIIVRNCGAGQGLEYYAWFVKGAPGEPGIIQEFGPFESAVAAARAADRVTCNLVAEAPAGFEDLEVGDRCGSLRSLQGAEPLSLGANPPLLNVLTDDAYLNFPVCAIGELLDALQLKVELECAAERKNGWELQPSRRYRGVYYDPEECDDECNDGRQGAWIAALDYGTMVPFRLPCATESEAAIAWDARALTIFGAPAFTQLNRPRNLALLRARPDEVRVSGDLSIWPNCLPVEGDLSAAARIDVNAELIPLHAFNALDAP
ncbi:hypothetical protein T492DRAFT_1083988, partial [Pavlovales sp. CCMP2436]